MDDQPVRAAPTLSDLIASRLCHDLVNPLGAIGNGVELLEMTGAGNGPELELIRDAVRDAQARIRFFRIAFGAAGPGQTVSARESRGAVQDLFRGTRMEADWSAVPDLPRAQVKLAFLMVLCAESALPMGGRMRVTPDQSDQWRLKANSDRVQMDENVWSVLRFGVAAAGRPLRPAEVQFAALHATAEDLDLTVNFVRTETGLDMSTA